MINGLYIKAREPMVLPDCQKPKKEVDAYQRCMIGLLLFTMALIGIISIAFISGS